jgi:hypothetical protein
LHSYLDEHKVQALLAFGEITHIVIKCLEIATSESVKVALELALIAAD